MAKKYLKLAGILKRLLFERDIKPIDLARATDLPAPTIHRLVTGKSTRPYKSSLQPIADYFAITVEQLIGEEPLPEDAGKQVSTRPTSNVSEIPVINWNDIGRAEPQSEVKGHIYLSTEDPDRYMAAELDDKAMEPQFADGAILLIDTKGEIKDRAYVVAYIAAEQRYIFRKLMIDDQHLFLRPLRDELISDDMRLMRKDDKIIGIVAESREWLMEGAPA